MEIAAYAVVLSTAGHDKKKVFAVVGFSGADYVLIADGKIRKLEKPKKKKLKHLKLIGRLDCFERTAATNRLLRKALNAFTVDGAPTEGGI